MGAGGGAGVTLGWRKDGWEEPKGEGDGREAGGRGGRRDERGRRGMRRRWYSEGGRVRGHKGKVEERKRASAGGGGGGGGEGKWRGVNLIRLRGKLFA